MLADGTLVRTGQWGIGEDGSQSASAHLSRFSFGPSVEGLFLQSNLGVVTKMGIWLLPAPEAYMACSFSMPRIGDVGVVVEVFGEMRREGTLPDTVYVSNFLEHLGVLGPRSRFWPGDGAIPEWRVDELMSELGVGYWTARFGLYGAKKIVKGRFEAVKRILGERAGEGKLEGRLYEAERGKVLIAGDIPGEDGGFFVGVPSLWSLPMVKFRVPETGGVGAHYDFSPIIPTEGGRVEEWVGVAKRCVGAMFLMCWFSWVLDVCVGCCVCQRFVPLLFFFLSTELVFFHIPYLYTDILLTASGYAKPTTSTFSATSSSTSGTSSSLICCLLTRRTRLTGPLFKLFSASCLKRGRRGGIVSIGVMLTVWVRSYIGHLLCMLYKFMWC